MCVQQAGDEVSVSVGPCGNFKVQKLVLPKANYNMCLITVLFLRFARSRLSRPKVRGHLNVPSSCDGDSSFIHAPRPPLCSRPSFHQMLNQLRGFAAIQTPERSGPARAGRGRGQDTELLGEREAPSC